jgi:UDP-N-acetylmuramyl tripeptide synthase
MHFSDSQIKTLRDLQIYDDVMHVLEKNNKNQTQAILEIINETKQYLRLQINKIVHKNEFLNPYKLTTLDPIILQKSLQKMVANKCEVAVIEISSQGLEQNRHWGLGKFDIAAFLNLYPEHIDSHGSFENYKDCKLRLFQSLKNDGIALVNGDDKFAEEFLNKAPIKSQQFKITKGNDFIINKFSQTIYKSFEVKSQVDFSTQANISSHLMADFEIYNIMIAARMVDKFINRYFGLSLDYKVLGGNYYSIPGRLEWVVQDNQIVFGVE